MFHCYDKDCPRTRQFLRENHFKNLMITISDCSNYFIFIKKKIHFLNVVFFLCRIAGLIAAHCLINI